MKASEDVATLADIENLCICLPLNQEKQTQSEIENRLSNASIKFTREAKIGDGSIIDFLVGDIGIEVKIKKASKAKIYNQVHRYCQSPHIKCMVLLSSVALRLPAEINDKPVRVISLGQSWL